MVILAILAIFSGTVLTSCEKVKGKGEVISESRSVSAFQTISLSMSATVYYTQDDTYRLTISGQENVINEIITRVEGNTLVIRVKNGVILGSHEPVRVYVSAPDARNMTVSGSGDVYVEGNWDNESVSMNISGSGNIHIDSLYASELTATISGSGDIRANGGIVDREELRISGSGEMELRNVVAEKVYSTTSGSGDMYVMAGSYLEVTISGSGNMWYRGNPAIETHISGSGNLRKL